MKAAQRYTAKVKGTVPVGGARSPSNIDADGMTPRLSESQRKAVLTAVSEGLGRRPVHVCKVQGSM